MTPAAQHKRELRTARRQLAAKLRPVLSAQHARIVQAVGDMDVIALPLFENMLSPASEHALVRSTIEPLCLQIASVGAAAILPSTAGLPLIKAIDLSKFRLPKYVGDQINAAVQAVLSLPYWQGMHRSLLDRIIAIVRKLLGKGSASKVGTLATLKEHLRKTLKPRINQIAETEANMFLNFGRIAAMNGMDLTAGNIAKGWVCILDQVTRDTHAMAGGQVVALNENFNIGGWPAPFPGHWSLPPEERCNCRCAVWPVEIAASPSPSSPQPKDRIFATSI